MNKLGVSHVGCLVHGCFNASIPKPSLVPLETWRDAGPRIGEELEFEVIALDADTVGVLLIRGRLGRTRQVVWWSGCTLCRTVFDPVCKGQTVITVFCLDVPQGAGAAGCG